MSLDSESLGMHVTFQNVSYSIKGKRGKSIFLLKDITGTLYPNSMTALLGPSGSGKTTLLDVLSGRKTVGTITGDILFDQQKPTKAFWRRYTGYVEQQDTLIATMTVEEMLYYTCMMKSPITESKESKHARVERVIKDLALDTCRKVPVGNALKRGISGGQMKRANIGLAMVAADPRVLFLDEPTTGLDSFTAAEVMDAVHHLTITTGITVCATIHSPSEYVFGLFDRVLVLVSGRVVHFGKDLSPFAAMVNNGIPLIEHNDKDGSFSNAEWLIDTVVSADRGGKADELADMYAASDLAAQNQKDAKHFATAPLQKRSNTINMSSVRQSTATPWWYSLFTLLKYRGRADFRDPEFAIIRIMDKLVVQLIILTLYLNVGTDMSMANNPNIIAATFMFVILPSYTASGYMPSIVLERPLYVRERSDGMYTPFIYLCYKFIEEVSLLLLSTPAFAAMIFYGLRLQGVYIVVWLSYLFTALIGIVLAYAIANFSPNIGVANTVLPAFVTASLFFTGNLIIYSDMSVYLKWVTYVDFLHYPWAAITVSIFQDKPDIQSLSVAGTPMLEYLSLNLGSAWVYLGIELGFFVFFSFLAWVSLALVRHEQR